VTEEVRAVVGVRLDIERQHPVTAGLDLGSGRAGKRRPRPRARLSGRHSSQDRRNAVWTPGGRRRARCPSVGRARPAAPGHSRFPHEHEYRVSRMKRT
jgi:hypothetical protein